VARIAAARRNPELLMQFERLGMGLSVACAAHCLALPVLAGFTCCATGSGPAGGDGGGWALLEPVLLGSVALVGYGTLGAAFRRHRRLAPLLLLSAGLVVMVGGHQLTTGWAGGAAGVTGALLVVAGHLANRWLARTHAQVCC
jgi:hypothetical protein